jgi:hypothetical protein
MIFWAVSFWSRSGTEMKVMPRAMVERRKISL